MTSVSMQIPASLLMDHYLCMMNYSVIPKKKECIYANETGVMLPENRSLKAIEEKMGF